MPIEHQFDKSAEVRAWRGRVGEGKPLPGPVASPGPRSRGSDARGAGCRRVRATPGSFVFDRAYSRPGSEGVDGAAGLGVEDAPVDELLGEVTGRLVVDDRE